MTDPVIDFLPYQKAWINDTARFKIGMITRRGGKTFATAGEAVDDCITAEIERRKTRWTILSRSEATAREAVEEAVRPMTQAYYEVYSTLAKRGAVSFSEEEFIVPAHIRTLHQGDQVHEVVIKEATYKAQQVRFPGGSRITAISASPDAARGFGGNLILDEFAFHRDSRRIWGAAFPMAARGQHKIRIISTPNGKGNKFHELMTTKDNGWSKHHIDIHEAVEQGLDVDPQELRAALSDEDIWAQEFLLEWREAATAWLPYEMISACEDARAGQPAAYQGGPCFVGVDIAARNDLFVIWVAELVGARLITREIIEKQTIPFAEQDRLLADVFRRYAVLRCVMDQTGMGEKPVEDAKAAHGETRVEGVLFTAPAKLDLAIGLKERMEDRSLLIPEGNPLLRADLHAIKSVIGPTGIRRLVAEGETDGHADRFWAAALACAGAGDRTPEYGYTPARQSPARARARSFLFPDHSDDERAADRDSGALGGRADFGAGGW